MTDEDRPNGDEPRFDDPADAWVRDVLASARVTGPVPEDVADRLDATLASLRAERTGEPDDPEDGAPAPVVPLHRRLAPLLAAAAAVVVVAGGAVAVTRLGGDHTGSPQSAAGSSSADRAQNGPSAQGPLAQSSAGIAVPHLSRATFAQDAATAMRSFSTDLSGEDGVSAATPGGDAGQPQPETAEKDVQKGAAPPVTATPRTQALVAPAAACPGPQAVGAVTVPATLDGAPVALVFRPPSAAGQRVEAWSCDGSTLLAAASVGR